MNLGSECHLGQGGAILLLRVGNTRQNWTIYLDRYVPKEVALQVALPPPVRVCWKKTMPL